MATLISLIPWKMRDEASSGGAIPNGRHCTLGNTPKKLMSSYLVLLPLNSGIDGLTKCH